MGFHGQTHKPESNARRSESIKKLYADGRPEGMGFKRKYANEAEAKAARALAQRRRVLKHRYGLTLEQYDEMMEFQSGVCAICGEENESGQPLYVDHCHESGKVRGLLCRRCNTLIGCAEDSTAVLTEAIIYLAHNRTVGTKAAGVLSERMKAGDRW